MTKNSDQEAYPFNSFLLERVQLIEKEMQVQELNLDRCEVIPNIATVKFDSIVAVHETYAAEGLSQVIQIDLYFFVLRFRIS